MIRKVGSKYCVYSHQTNKNFGCYDTLEKAEARLAQIKKFGKYSEDDLYVQEFAEIKKVPYIRVGTFQPSNQEGQVEYTLDDLKHLAEVYNPEYHTATVNVDHKPEGKSIGYIKKLHLEGNSLYADLAGVPQEVINDLSEKRYLRVSPEIYINLDGMGKYPKGLAFLGQKAPAIKGMKPLVELSEDDNGQYHILKEVSMGKEKDKDTHDTPITEEFVEKTVTTKVKDFITNLFSSKEKDTPEENQAFAEMTAKFNEFVKKTDKTIVELTEKLNEANARADKAERDAKVNALVSKVPPGLRKAGLEALAEAVAGQSVKFTEDGKEDGKEVEVSLLDILSKIVDELPSKESLFSEKVTGGNDPKKVAVLNKVVPRGAENTGLPLENVELAMEVEMAAEGKKGDEAYAARREAFIRGSTS